MARLSAVAKNEITRVLDATYFKQHGFTVKYDDGDNPLITITFSASPEYQFVINSINDDNAFITNECPGTHLDAAETFQRSDFDLCMNAIEEWAQRILDRQKGFIIDEFGGVGG